MSKNRPTNVAASVHRRLNDLAHFRGEDSQYVLVNYAIERFLYRLTRSEHGGQFLLKGAVLFRLWSGVLHRPTKDLDLLGHGEPTAESLGDIFRAVCTTDVSSRHLDMCGLKIYFITQ